MARNSNNYYVTTSIPYVNGEPHLGHAMEFIMADVLARYARQQGKKVIFSTGTDEHGGKIAEKAAELKLTPQALAEQMSKKFLELTRQLNISQDRFIRTTDKAHEQRSQLIWDALAKDIYKGKYVGWYCTGDEAFFSEEVVKANNGVCPNHNRPYEKIEEENYFFKLSSYSEQIKKKIEDDSFRIIPKTRRNEILALIKDGLEDISVSRPKDKISWGVPVPGDSGHVMYVWFEALMNYITVLGYPEHADFKHFWPADAQVVGKDIIRQHAAIWPAMLMALGIPLPKMLYVHGHINATGGTKMSKSLGNVVAPEEILKKYGTDAFRYYFLRHIPSYEDGDFSWETFEAAYNNELANELGNAVQRTVAMIQKYQNGLIGDMPASEHDTASYSDALEHCRFDRALDAVWQQVRGLNQYIDEEKPWTLAKVEDDHLGEVLAYQVSCLLEIADMLKPLLPSTATKIHDIFSGGVIKSSLGILFPKSEVKQTQQSVSA
jgi:methionyl-tRNA synthetase